MRLLAHIAHAMGSTVLHNERISRDKNNLSEKLIGGKELEICLD